MSTWGHQKHLSWFNCSANIYMWQVRSERTIVLFYLKRNVKKKHAHPHQKGGRCWAEKKQTANVTNSLHTPVLPVYRTMKTAMSQAHLLFIRWRDEEQVCSRRHLFRDPSYLCHKPSAPVPKDTFSHKKKKFWCLMPREWELAVSTETVKSRNARSLYTWKAPRITRGLLQAWRCCWVLTLKLKWQDSVLFAFVVWKREYQI